MVSRSVLVTIVCATAAPTLDFKTNKNYWRPVSIVCSGLIALNPHRSAMIAEQSAYVYNEQIGTLESVEVGR